jgi:excinuclease UvrABC nuclease subunit
MIVFQDGRPAKKEYRRFSIKTVRKQRFCNDAGGDLA